MPLSRDEITADAARLEMLKWATGEFSHTNLYMEMGMGAADRVAVQASIQAADSSMVQKWAAVYVALRDENVVGGALDEIKRMRDMFEGERREHGPAGSPRYERALASRDALDVAIKVIERREPPQTADSFEADTRLLGYFGSIYRTAQAVIDDADSENVYALKMAMTLPPDIEAALEGPRGANG